MTTLTETITQDTTLLDLIDSIVATIDLDRAPEIERLREALQPFDAVELFNDELRLNGVNSSDTDRQCFCEAWL